MVLYRNVVKRRFCTGNTLWLPIFFTTAENECVHCTCTASGRKLADNSTDNEHKWQQVISEDTSPPNSNTSSFRPVFSVPFSYFLFIFFFSRCTLPDFPSVSFLASLPFSPRCHRTTTGRCNDNFCNMEFHNNFRYFCNMAGMLITTIYLRRIWRMVIDFAISLWQNLAYGARFRQYSGSELYRCISKVPNCKVY